MLAVRLRLFLAPSASTVCLRAHRKPLIVSKIALFSRLDDILHECHKTVVNIKRANVEKAVPGALIRLGTNCRRSDTFC